MVRNDSHNEDGGGNDAFKEGRGLISATLSPAATTTWRIQGSSSVDSVRGPLNNGGLFGERTGWYLPGFADGGWTTRPVPDTSATAGTAWYRTQFDLALPSTQDSSLGLTIGTQGTRGGNYRALIFVNGWNMGQYIANVGPQHTFVLPTGILNPHGHNTIALAVTSDGGPANSLERVALTNLGTVLGGVPVSPVG
jgi:beta-galactosidase GanA